jgi:plastocyanin
MNTKSLSFVLMLILLFSAIVTLLAGSAFAQDGTGETQNITLYGSASQGWGFTQQSMSIPGPQISFEEDQVVNMTLISADGIVHDFFVDYNGNGAPDSGEPSSPTFTSTINYQFTPDRTGEYTYYCSFHPATMHGNTNIIPELSILAVLTLLIASTTIALIYKKKR